VKEIFKNLEDAVEKFRTEKKEDAFNNRKRTIDVEYGAAIASIAEIQNKIKKLSPPLSTKVNRRHLICSVLFVVLTFLPFLLTQIDELTQLNGERFGKTLASKGGKKEDSSAIDKKIEGILSSI